jgi:glycine betaine catabolism B
MKFETSLKEIIPRTSDVSSFRFPRPEGLEYKAGQYMLVNIKSGDKELLHAFSFSSSPTEKDFIEFTKKFTPNEYSVTLKTLKPSSWARIDAPYGKFTFEGEYPKVALLTGGIGITPFRSIIKYCTDKHVNSNIFLFHGCRTPRDFAFQTDLEQMQKQNPNLHLVFTANEPDSSWKGSVGNITPDLVKQEMPDFAERVYYACGPPGMIQAMTTLVKQLGLPESQLKLESFAGYT